MANQQIAVVFEQIAQLLEIRGGNPFRIRSYQRAAELLQQLSLNIAQAIESQPVRLSAIPGLGKGTLSRIKEIVETGACRELQQLTAQIPLSLLELRRLRHLGPRRIYQIWKTLGELKTWTISKGRPNNSSLGPCLAWESTVSH